MYIRNKEFFEIYKNPTPWELRSIMPICRFICDSSKKDIYVFPDRIGSHNRMWEIISEEITRGTGRTPDKYHLLMGTRNKDGTIKLTTRFQSNKKLIYSELITGDWSWADKYFPITKYIEDHKEMLDETIRGKK